MLVAPDLVLTCAHVLPADEVTLVHRGTRVAAAPEFRDEDGDVAVLRLAAPVDAVCAPLRAPTALIDHPYVVQGFAGGVHTESRGRLGGRVAPGWVQMEHTSGRALDRGFSGAPVWDDAVGAVVGIVVAAHRAVGGGNLIPVDEIARRWPPVTAFTGWRVDLDDAFDTHWLPRARGVEPHEAADVWHFTGRRRALADLARYLGGPADGRVRAVTGSPGSGKSAVLARTVLLADRTALVPADTLPPGVPLPPVGSVTVAVHARGKTPADVVRAIADAAEVEAGSPAELLRRCGPVSVVVDALDEAAGDAPTAIATLLNRLASNPERHVVVGTRVGARGSSANLLLKRLGDPVVLDLDGEDHLDHRDVVAYAERRTGDPALAAAIAEHAAGNFLIAQLACLTGSDRLPTSVGAAVDDYLTARFDDPRRVRELLLPLAFAEGAGLPEGPEWLALANALSAAAHTARDLRDVLTSAASYLVERADHRYRLFHQSLDDTFREEHPGHDPERVVYETLRSLVTDWSAAPPYTREHLAAHAVAAGRLDELVEDLDFVLAVAPEHLVPHLPHVRSDRATVVRHVYRRAVHGFRAPEAHRAAYFALKAEESGFGHLVRELPPLPWRAEVLAWRREHAQQVLAHLPTASVVGLWLDARGAPAALTEDERGDVVLHRHRDYRLAEVDRLPFGRSGFTAHTRVVLDDGREVGLSVDYDGRLRRWSFTDGLRLTGEASLGETTALWDADSTATPAGDLLAVVANRWSVHVVDFTGDVPVVRHRVALTSARARAGHAAIGVHAGEVHLAHADGPAVRLATLSESGRVEPRWQLAPVGADPVVRFAPGPGGLLLLVGCEPDEDAAPRHVADSPLPVVAVDRQTTVIASGRTPGGRALVATGDLFGRVSLFDADAGLVPAWRLRRGHPLSVEQLAVGTGPGQRAVLLSHGEDQHVRMWDLDQVPPRPADEPPPMPRSALRPLLFRGDGDDVVVAGPTLGGVDLCAVGDRLHPHPPLARGEAVIAAAVGRDRPLLAVLRQPGRLDLWEHTATGPRRLGSHAVTERWPEDTDLVAAVDDAGRQVVTRTGGGLMTWWTRTGGRWRGATDHAGGQWVTGLQLYRVGDEPRLLVTGEVAEVRLPGGPAAALEGQGRVARARVEDHRGEPIAAVCTGDALGLYSLAGDEFTPWCPPWPHDPTADLHLALAFPAPGRAVVATGGDDGRLRVWSCARGGTREARAAIELNTAVRGLLWTRDHRLVVWCGNGVVRFGGFA